MTLTVSEIESWSAGDVREVFHAATSRAQAAQDAADGIASLPALTTWGGVAAQAAKESLGRTHLDLTAHSGQALAVAAAARTAADNIEAIQQALKSLESDADDVGLQVNRATNKIERKPHSTDGFRWQQQHIPGLQQRLDGIVAMANLVDRDLANAITMADNPVPTNSSVPPPTAPLPPDVAALQRANDEAMLDAAARVTTAQDAVDKALAQMYTHGPGTPEFEAVAAKLPGLKQELVKALADAGAIPDFATADPNSVGVGQQGVNFSYRLPDGRLAQVTSTKFKDGSVELTDNGASAVYTYKDGKLVGTRFLDEGRAIATVEPLFTAVTAPFGIGPAIKGGEAAYLGLRGLFAKESIEVLAGSSADDVIARGSEIVATRAESAADNLAVSTLDDLPIPGTAQSHPVFDITTDHAQHLGFDHARGRFVASEAETGLRLEQDLGVKLTRATREDSFDYFDPVSGRSYDAVGNFPGEFFDKQWPRLQQQITMHLNKADIVPVDVSRFTPSQQQLVQEFVKGLANPRIIVIGAQ